MCHGMESGFYLNAIGSHRVTQTGDLQAPIFVKQKQTATLIKWGVWGKVLSAENRKSYRRQV